MIVIADGSVDYSLPPHIAEIVETYAQPECSLLEARALSPAMPQTFALRWLAPGSREFQDGKAPTPNPGKQLTPCSLCLSAMDEFYEGWKHPHKKVPLLKHVYAVDLPPTLHRRYTNYSYVVLQS